MRVYCDRDAEWPHRLDFAGIPTRPRCGPNVLEIVRNQVQDLVPDKGVEVGVLSSALLSDRVLGGCSGRCRVGQALLLNRT